MIVNSSTPFTTASFFTSFNSRQRRPSLGLPTSPLNRSFLQSPLWNTITTTTKPIEQKESKKESKKPEQQQQQLQQAIYVLPKTPSNVSIYLQLPAFRSLSVLMRCGHVSQLVENWLCNPMDQLKRNAKRAYQQQHNREKKRITRKRSSSLCIMSASEEKSFVPKTSSSTPLVCHTGTSSVVNNNYSLVPYQKNQHRQPISSLFIHFQMGQQSQPMEIQYTHVPCLFTIVCVTYHCGSVSVSINQIESLDFLSSTARMNPFLIKCDLLPNHPVTIHQLTSSSDHLYSTVPQICDYASEDEDMMFCPQLPSIEEISNDHSPELPSIEEIPNDHKDSNDALLHLDKSVMICRPEDPAPVQLLENEEKSLKPSLFPETEDVELMHIKESILYHEEDDDDDDESYLYSSSEEFSVLDDLDTEEDEPEDAAQAALLRLVQDTLEYIQSGSALSEELNKLEYKLYNYSRAHTSVYN